MAYGLQVFGPSGQTWFDSNNAATGVPVAYVTVPGSSGSSGSWTAGTYSNTFSGYAYFTLKVIYISNMYLTVSVTSGPAVSNPSVSITNYGVDAATVLIIATASG